MENNGEFNRILRTVGRGFKTTSLGTRFKASGKRSFITVALRVTGEAR